MMTSGMCFSVFQFPRCRILSLQRTTYVRCLSHKFHIARHSYGVCSKFKLLGSHSFEPSQEASNRTLVLRPRSTIRTSDVEKSEPSSVRQSSTISGSVSSCFRSIQHCDNKHRILEIQDPKQLVRPFVFDIETTGFCKENGRIIEIAVRDLSGGKNSCLHTLINPEQHVPNSDFHGITTKMVNRPDVPRMKDFIPILLQYIRSRPQIAGSVCLFIGHNSRSFDVPFLVKEFSRCSMKIPPYCQFSDTVPPAREWMRKKGSRRYSLEALSEHFNIQPDGESHRAMADVNLLVAILERLTVEMKLTVADFLENSFQAPDPMDLMKAKKKS